MLNLPHLQAVSFSKGCYVGQKIIARTQYLGKSKRHLYLIDINATDEIEPGKLVFAKEQEVGMIIDIAVNGANSLALAVIRIPRWQKNCRVATTALPIFENVNTLNLIQVASREIK